MIYSNSFQKSIQKLVVFCLLFFVCLFSFIASSFSQNEIEKVDSTLAQDVKEEIVLEEFVDVILAIDVSASMRVEDVTPTRLEAVKSAAQQLMSVYPTARYGLVIFAGESMVYAPLGDTEVDLYQLLEKITTDLVDGTGTVIGEALDTSIKEFERMKSINRKIIIFSDGATSETEDIFKRALLLASKRNVEVYAIGVGQGGKASITTPDQEKIIIDSPYNDISLKQISTFTNGKYYHAQSFEEMSKIAEEISLLLTSK